MLTIDTSDIKRLANEYKNRSQQIRDNPFGQYRHVVKRGIMELFRRTLNTNEGVTYAEQKRFYTETGIGYYGADTAHERKMINPQEFWGQRGNLGHGRFFGDSYPKYSPGNAGQLTFDIVTEAVMQPYPNKKTGRSLPAMPIMHYFRHGWNDPDNPSHHMDKRPFGNWLATMALAGGYIGKYLPYLLGAAGFRRK